MTYRIRLHAGARADLEATLTWVSRFAGRAALRRIGEIEAAIGRLAVLPHRGTRRDEVLRGMRAVPVGARAVVAFVGVRGG